ncbi:MAG: hypothetical protein GXO08_03955 [Aquificae bacterium]|nr:hypothetical protein [Aquificota bacterium]
MVGEKIEKLYAVYLIPFTADESYSLILIYRPEGENFYKALFLTKSLETGEEHKNLLKLDKSQFDEKQAVEVFDFTVKDLFRREIQSIDPGAKLIELKFEDPSRVEYNLSQVRELLKKAGFAD